MSEVISNVGRSHEEELRDRLYYAIRRDGGDPSSFLDLLATAVDERAWEGLGCSFTEFVKHPAPYGLDLSPDRLRTVLHLPHKHEANNPEVQARMKAMRAEVERLLGEEIEPLGGVGRPSATEENDGGSIISPRGNTTDYVVARLKRDDPTLAERVVRGELTANAAAREAGIRRPRIVVSTPERIAISLRRHLDHDAVLKLAALLFIDDKEPGG